MCFFRKLCLTYLVEQCTWRKILLLAITDMQFGTNYKKKLQDCSLTPNENRMKRSTVSLKSDELTHCETGLSWGKHKQSN